MDAPQSMMRAPMRLPQLASDPRPSVGSPIEVPGAASVPLTQGILPVVPVTRSKHNGDG
ncbi:hypothetical protein HMPREF3223_02356 [Cutibacterium avidum]|nr:hypothetical protein HMPREF3223_02356 [Cutibacterium avidum]